MKVGIYQRYMPMTATESSTRNRFSKGVSRWKIWWCKRIPNSLTGFFL